MQTIVGVLRGGPSREHSVSLKTGAAMLKHLPEEHFAARDIYIDKSGQWYERGRPATPERVLRQIDVVLNGLHGEYGEDGEAQKVLERFGVPYVGSDSNSSALAMHKLLAKLRVQEAGMRTPEFRHVEPSANLEAMAYEITRAFHQPVIVKPVGWGSSVGISRVGGYAPVLHALQNLFAQGAPSILVEERIRGREVTIGVIEGFRGEKLYVLPTVEITPPKGDFFSYDAKYSGASRETCPGNFSRVVTEELQRLARVAHRSLGLRHYSRSDFIVAPHGIYYLETNTLPALASENSFTRSLFAVGASLGDFLSYLIVAALRR